MRGLPISLPAAQGPLMPSLPFALGILPQKLVMGNNRRIITANPTPCQEKGTPLEHLWTSFEPVVGSLATGFYCVIATASVY